MQRSGSSRPRGFPAWAGLPSAGRRALERCCSCQHSGCIDRRSVVSRPRVRHIAREYPLRSLAATLRDTRGWRPADTQRSPRFGAGSQRGVIGCSVAHRRTLQFIQENYARDVGLSDTAAAVHVSPFHHRACSSKPRCFSLPARPSSPREQCQAPALPEIANAVGFADQSHLTWLFKRLTRVWRITAPERGAGTSQLRTPGTYRRLNMACSPSASRRRSRSVRPQSRRSWHQTANPRAPQCAAA